MSAKAMGDGLLVSAKGMFFGQCPMLAVVWKEIPGTRDSPDCTRSNI